MRCTFAVLRARSCLQCSPQHLSRRGYCGVRRSFWLRRVFVRGMASSAPAAASTSIRKPLFSVTSRSGETKQQSVAPAHGVTTGGSSKQNASLYGRARLGLVTGCVTTPVPTPNCLVYTSRGSLSYLSSDHSQKHLPLMRGLTIPVQELMHHPGASVLAASPHGMHGFLGVGDDILSMVTLRNTMRGTLGPGLANGFSVHAVKGKQVLSVRQYVRFVKLLRPPMIVAIADEVPADAGKNRCRKAVDRSVAWLNECISLLRTTEEPSEEDEVDVSEKKMSRRQQKKAAQRVLKEQEAAASDAPPPPAAAAVAAPASSSASSSLSSAEVQAQTTVRELSLAPNQSTYVLAAVQGGGDLRSREHCATAMAQMAGVDGYVLGGLNTSETSEEREALVAAMLNHLPENALRVVQTQGDPESVLSGVDQGIDLFEASYPLWATEQGFVLTFPIALDDLPSVETELEVTQTGKRSRLDDVVPDDATAKQIMDRNKRYKKETKSEEADAKTASSSSTQVPHNAVSGQPHTSALWQEPDDMNAMKFNMRDRRFVKDLRPVLPHCTCYTCQHHTRAYIYHLLNTHELLAQVLLQTHNIHHYTRFFEEIRLRVAEDAFQEYRQRFMNFLSAPYPARAQP